MMSPFENRDFSCSVYWERPGLNSVSYSSGSSSDDRLVVNARSSGEVGFSRARANESGDSSSMETRFSFHTPCSFLMM
mgnify:CR=1 FL=1